MSESQPQSMMARIRAFPRTFWVINSSELLERGAYYSLGAVLPLFARAAMMAGGTPIADATAAATNMSAVLFLLLYLVPVLTAPLAERLGYRTSLAVVFTLLAGGYVSAALATQDITYTTTSGFQVQAAHGAGASLALLWTAVALIGLGAGMYKPIPASIVAQTSREEHRNFAFSIYYACINVGALVFPTTAGFLALAFLGRDATIAFSISAGLSLVNLVLCVVLFRNLRPAQKDIDVFTGIKRLGEVFKYPAFLVLVVIYTGFWFMYAQSQTTIQLYMTDFGRMPASFNALFQQSLNPLVIIVATPFVGGLLGRFKSLPLIIGGIAVYALGFLVVGFTGGANLPTFLGAGLFLFGIVVFSLGELAAHPSYLSYVSKIAPPGKETVFLGYSFIPIGVGYYLGSKFGGKIYSKVALTDGHPALFWAYMASVGLATASAFFIYNHFLTRPARDVAPGPGETKRRGGSAARPAIALVLVLLLVPAVIGAAALQVEKPQGSGATPLQTASIGSVSTVKLADDAQKLACGKEYAKKVTLPANATGEAVFAISWKTPAPSSPAMTSSPDTYELHVTPPSGDMAMKPGDAKGNLEVKLPATPGDYAVKVVLTKCGGESPVTPIPIPGGAGSSPPRTEGSFTLAGSYQASK